MEKKKYLKEVKQWSAQQNQQEVKPLQNPNPGTNSIATPPTSNADIVAH